jgi:zeaxanthin glucosyltransferase
MAHFAFFSPPFLSHLRALQAIAGELVARGHRATFVHQPDVGASIDRTRFGFHAVGSSTHPPGSLAGIVARAARPGGPFGLMRVIRDVAASTDMLCRDGPEALAAIRADFIVADQMEAAGGLLAEALRLPYVSVACAMPVNREPLVPPAFLPWAFEATAWGEQRNRGGERVSDYLMRPHGRVIAAHAMAFALSPRERLADCLSPYAQLGQSLPGLEFPRTQLPASFHHVGALRPPLAAEPPLELAIADDRPLAFASLGSLQGGRHGIFRAVARACRALGVQLLVAHCGGLDAHRSAALLREGASWVTDFAPQRAVMARASVVVTHAGINTVLDALEYGVPMLAIPIAFDQPGTAARVLHAGVGEMLSRHLLTAGKVRGALSRLLADGRCRARAQALRAQALAAGGAPRAADVIEQVLATRRPVTPASMPRAA